MKKSNIIYKYTHTRTGPYLPSCNPFHNKPVPSFQSASGPRKVSHSVHRQNAKDDIISIIMTGLVNTSPPLTLMTAPPMIISIPLDAMFFLGRG